MNAIRLAVPLLTVVLLALTVLSFTTTRSSSAYAFAAARNYGLADGSKSQPANAARSYLAVKPLSEHAVLSLALAREPADRKAEFIVRRAVAIEPRFLEARTWLAIRSREKGQVDAFVSEMEALVRLRPGRSAQISTLLAEAARDPTARASVARRFANRPEILQVAATAAQIGLSGEALVELLRPTRLEDLTEGVGRAQTLIAAQFIRERRYSKAREAWYALAKQKPLGFVFDGTFQDVQGAPPFGWSFPQAGQVESAIKPASGNSPAALHVESEGSLLAKLAEQTLALPPGRYRLGFVARVQGLGPAVTTSPFFWAISCRSGPPITEAFVPGQVGRWTRGGAEFSVPTDCPMQSLTLRKKATPNGRGLRLAVSRVSVAASEAD